MNTFSAKGKSISRPEGQNTTNLGVGHALHKTGEKYVTEDISEGLAYKTSEVGDWIAQFIEKN